MFEILNRLEAAPGRLVDLGCGPGSLAGRARENWPAADVVGIDFDPVLLELGRRTLAERVRWIDADLRGPGWSVAIEPGSVDAVLSTTALHWLSPEELCGVADEAGTLLRESGVFITYDPMWLASSAPRLRALSHQLHLDRVDEAVVASGGERWDDWWASLAAEPDLIDRFAQREDRMRTRRRGPGPSAEEFVTAFRDAGFAEVGTVRQIADRHMLVAIR